MEIRKVDSLNQIQIQKSAKEPNKNQKNKIKEAEASSLEAMNSYGKAQVNLSFKGNKPQSDKKKAESKKSKNILYIIKNWKRIYNTLLNEKDKDGNPRYNIDNSIDLILGEITPDNKELFYTVYNMKKENGENYFDFYDILRSAKENKKYTEDLVKKVQSGEIQSNYLPLLLDKTKRISLQDIKYAEKILGKQVLSSFSRNDFVIATQFNGLIKKQNINEIPISKKKELLRRLVASNVDLFTISDNIKKYMPLIPTSQEEYCSLLPALVKSIGIETKELSEAQEKKAIKSISELSYILANISDDDFNMLNIEQEYSTSEFIKDTFNLVKDLSLQERQKVYDYFGFELHHNKFGTQVDDNPRHSFDIQGYPINLNNGKKLAQITDHKTKEVVNKLRPFVIKYSENNKITCNNLQLEQVFNEILDVLPELRTEIGKSQHSTQDFDLFKHSLKVIQKISQQNKFKTLNDSDKKIMLLAGLLHDVTKPSGMKDETHPYESAFDAFFITKKLNLSRDEQIKLYSLLKSHEWFAFVNNQKTDNIQKAMQSVAFDLQYDNLFELSEIFTNADLKAVNSDGSTNIKGVYKDKSGLVIIKFNEVENNTWGKIGFPKGSISYGINAKGISSRHGKILKEDNVNTGNIKFFAHGLNYSNQLYKFDAFALPDSDALLSVSYTERPESKYRLFRPQGVLLNTETKYIHGGGNTDSGSGYGKSIDDFKQKYIFGGEREADRNYISDMIKDALNLTDKEYIKFVSENANKPFTEIEPEEVRNKIIKIFATINSNTRKGGREYNEMYISNPQVMGVFAYSQKDKVEDVMKFIFQQPDFLKQYAIDYDLPFIIFGD